MVLFVPSKSGRNLGMALYDWLKPLLGLELSTSTIEDHIDLKRIINQSYHPDKRVINVLEFIEVTRIGYSGPI